MGRALLSCPCTYACPEDGDTFVNIKAAWELARAGSCDNEVTMCPETINDFSSLNLRNNDTVTFRCLGAPGTCILIYSSDKSGSFFEVQGSSNTRMPTISLTDIEALCKAGNNANYGGGV
eukprot:scaffold5479_cov199-Amphora_coffeaeformis.AAC.44